MPRLLPIESLIIPLYFLSIVLTAYDNDCHAGEYLDPMPSVSSFEDQIEMGNEASMSEPKEAPLLRWDFSEDHVYPYGFHQDTVTEHQIDDGFGSFQGQRKTQQMESNGRLSLKSEGNQIARFVLENLTVSMEIDLSDSGEPQTMTSQAPPFVIQGIKEDGKMQLGNSPQELLLRTLFPIPPEPLTMGESVWI